MTERHKLCKELTKRIIDIMVDCENDIRDENMDPKTKLVLKGEIIGLSRVLAEIEKEDSFEKFFSGLNQESPDKWIDTEEKE